jgi:hypothetical protein
VHPPPPVSTAPAVPAGKQVYVYEQKPITSRPFLVSPEQAQTIIDRFKLEYEKMGSPRILLYVNRELIDDETGLKLSARSETTEAVRGDLAHQSSPERNGDPIASPVPREKVTAKNNYRVTPRKATPLADRQTVRDIERLFGRPMRMGGVKLADQRVATQLIGDQPLENFTVPTEGEQARKDREALQNIADVVLEVLISSRDTVVPEVSGDRTYTVPDIQVTAIRLSDAAIIGQATASDLIGHGRSAGRAARNFDVREIAEATALSLMEDMLLK